MKKYDMDGMKGAFVTIYQNNYEQLCKLYKEDIKNVEMAALVLGWVVDLTILAN